MNEFKFEEAVTQAFRTSGGKQFGWRLVFWTAAALTIVLLVVLPLILPHYGDLLAINQHNVQAIMAGNPNEVDSKGLNALFFKSAPAFLLMMGGMWAVWVASEAALHRKVLKNEESPKQPLRLGKDELNVWLAQLGVFGLIIAIYIFGIMAISIVGGIISALIPVLGLLLVLVSVTAYLCILCAASVRLAPAAALSIKDDTTRVMAAKALTKGKFWTLFPAYLVVFIGGHILLSIVMFIAVSLVTGDTNFMTTTSGLGALDAADPKDAMAAAGERLKNPLIMLLGVLSIVAYSTALALYIVSYIGISSHAAKVWSAK